MNHTAGNRPATAPATGTGERPGTGHRGEPVLMLHSSASSGRQWRRLREEIGARFATAAPDLIGYGASPAWSGTGRFCLAEEVRRIMPPGDEPLHLIGHSFGGAVALAAALEQPHRIRSLTLIEPVVFTLLRHRTARDAMLYVEVARVAGAVARGLASGDYHAGMREFMDYWNGDGSWARLKPAQQEGYATVVAKVALDFQATLFQSLEDQALRALGVPTLLLRGERTTRPARRITDILCEQLGNARLGEIGGAGHMLPLTHPEAVNAAVRTHLEQHAGAATADGALFRLAG